MLFRPLILLAAAVLLAAQNPYGRMTGRVVDSSNAYVAGAAARVVQLETNIVTSTTTNQEGVYELLNLLPGQYQLIVERQGFKRFERSPLEVRVGDVLGIDVALEVGAISESVTVTAEAPLLESTTASMSQVIDNQQVSNLPLPGGSSNYLMQLSPGVIATNAPTHGWLPQARDSTSNISVAGTRTRNSEF